MPSTQSHLGLLSRIIILWGEKKKKKKQEKNKTITKEEKNGCTEDEMEVGFGCDYKTSIVIIIIFLLIVPHCSIPGVRSWSIFSSTFLYFSSSR